MEVVKNMMKKISLFFISGMLLFSCSSKTSVSNQNLEYQKNKEYLKEYVNKNENEKIVKKETSENFQRNAKEKRTDVVVKMDADSVERHLKKNLDKRKVETSMVPSPPIPIMVPAKVVRVLVYPYIDNYGNFHSPVYLYTEIKESRWVVGDFNSPSAVSSGESFTILER